MRTELINKINEIKEKVANGKTFVDLSDDASNDELYKEFNIKLEQDEGNTFLEKWYLYTVKKEIDFINVPTETDVFVNIGEQMEKEDFRNIVENMR